MSEDSGCAAVMVCGGPRCGGGADRALEALRPLIRLAPRSALVRTECPARCHPGDGSPATVVLQRCDERMRAQAAPRVVEFDDLCDLRQQVARWLLSDTTNAR